jgi:hypothetical protein
VRVKGRAIYRASFGNVPHVDGFKTLLSEKGEQRVPDQLARSRNVDDAGSWYVQDSSCDGTGGEQLCFLPPWTPSAHVNFYSRVWRTVGSAAASVTLITAPDNLSPDDPQATANKTGLCAPDMSKTSMVAVPCEQYLSANGDVRSFLSLVNGNPLGTN